jgi:hypothetical protein
MANLVRAFRRVLPTWTRRDSSWDISLGEKVRHNVGALTFDFDRYMICVVVPVMIVDGCALAK